MQPLAASSPLTCDLRVPGLRGHVACAWRASPGSPTADEPLNLSSPPFPHLYGGQRQSLHTARATKPRPPRTWTGTARAAAHVAGPRRQVCWGARAAVRSDPMMWPLPQGRPDFQNRRTEPIPPVPQQTWLRRHGDTMERGEQEGRQL